MSPRPTPSAGEAATFPNLASVPNRPKVAAPADRQAMQSTLVGDLRNARYTDDELRGRSIGASPRDSIAPSEAIPVAIVQFGVGSATFANQQRGAIEAAAAAYKQKGGIVRIVGHAREPVGDLPLNRQKLAKFELSNKRAETVAIELMRLGVDPRKVLVEAGPENTGSAKDDAGSAEIFLEN